MVPKCYFWGPGPWTIWGDDSKVILDILEGEEAVEQQFLATANNVSLNCANLRLEFLATDPKQSHVYVFVG